MNWIAPALGGFPPNGGLNMRLDLEGMLVQDAIVTLAMTGLVLLTEG
jgi:hypothetical protein